MRRALSALALSLLLLSLPCATASLAQPDVSTTDQVMLRNGTLWQIAKEAEPTTGDTTWVGFNSAYAGSNYWSIGVGARRPIAGSNTARQGYWDWDHVVHGDSLQGWWPVRHPYDATGGLTLADNLRPWWGLDYGNQVNYRINQGAPNRRTFGVTGVWHSDPGGVVTSFIPGTAPVAPAWGPLAGARSAWCGLRAHGDLTVVDPITNNAYNAAALEHVALNPAGNGTGTARNFPGYAGQWDQLLYRDVNITGAGPMLTLSFDYSTNMSTAVDLDPATRTGWYLYDPLTVNPGNYINSTLNPAPPVDEFSVWIGRPVEPVAGPSNDWTGSDGLDHDVYDAQRRWMAETVHCFDGTLVKVFSATGVNPFLGAPVVVAIPSAPFLGAGGNKVRVVFRVKTNRCAVSDDGTGSDASGFSSGGAGAAIVDNVMFGIGPPPVLIGDFESASSINNDTAVSPLSAWKSTGRPPAIFHHVHWIEDLVYEDLCGQPGSANRVCNLVGNVISAGDHDFSERLAGDFGSPEQERMDGIYSPTINLRTGGPLVANSQGLTGNDVADAEDYLIAYEVYAGAYDLPTYGNSWQFMFQSYPATQANGSRCWGEPRVPAFACFDPDRQCLGFAEEARKHGLIQTSNANGIPDSIRIGLRKISQCYRFGITTLCAPTLGAYWDNVSFGLLKSGPPVAASVYDWNWLQDTFPADENPAKPGTALFDVTLAKLQTGYNTAPHTLNALRLDLGGDSMVVTAPGPDIKVELVFRIAPGPGNYVTPGDPTSGLCANPGATVGRVPIVATDGTFWTRYILANGASGTPAGHPPGPHATRWNTLVWNSARCDTADYVAFPTQGNGFYPGPELGRWAATYHEADPKYALLGIVKNRCYLNSLVGPFDITCGRAIEPVPYPPAWLPPIPLIVSGWDGLNTTIEMTKILPDDLFTPGTSIQFYFKVTNMASGAVVNIPDATRVFPQDAAGPSYDAARWANFDVLPDVWKKPAYGGLGLACMLVVDDADRRGNERIWKSIADSIGATAAAKRGTHDGWIAAGGHDVNDPAGFVEGNQPAGSTWDLFNVRGAETLENASGTIGSRLSTREVLAAARAFGKDARNAPTQQMLETYYRIVLMMTGDLSRDIVGPFTDHSADDAGIVQNFLFGATVAEHRGFWLIGDGWAESLDGAPWLGLFSASLVQSNYRLVSGNEDACVDLSIEPPITPNGDIYGVRNHCLYTHDVLGVEAGGAAAAHYPDVGGFGPYASSVFHDAANPNFWQSLVDGFNLENLRSRFCENGRARLAYFYNAFTNIFGKICAIEGSPIMTLDTPVTGEPGSWVDAMRLMNTPLRQGALGIRLTLAHDDRVTVRVFDVGGRVVRTLADAQWFTAGEHTLHWDGADDGGRTARPGVYFVARTGSDGARTTRTAIILR